LQKFLDFVVFWHNFKFFINCPVQILVYPYNEMLLRVIGEESENEFHVVTVYKTSKIEKYWKEALK